MCHEVKKVKYRCSTLESSQRKRITLILPPGRHPSPFSGSFRGWGLGHRHATPLPHNPRKPGELRVRARLFRRSQTGACPLTHSRRRPQGRPGRATAQSRAAAAQPGRSRGSRRPDNAEGLAHGSPISSKLRAGRPCIVGLVTPVALRRMGETEQSKSLYDWFNFFSAGEKRIKLQDSFNIFTMLKLKLSSRLCV